MQRIRLLKGKSDEVDLSSVPPIDFAYIDGGHSYEEVRADTLRVVGLCNSGAVIVFDDDYDAFPGVQRLVAEFRDAGAVELGREGQDVAFVAEQPGFLLDRLGASYSPS
jgi:hypothetical protein